MSTLIRSHAGENKRVSNYPLGVWMGWVHAVGEERMVGQETEKKSWRGKEM